MRKWWRNDRTRLLLTLELAIVLPAAALIGVSVWNLKSIQRDKAVEAAIQRDFTQVLKFAEKKMNHRAEKMLTAARKQFPCPDDLPAPNLEKFLAEHPEFSHAFLFDQKTGAHFQAQPGRSEDADFHRGSEELAKWVHGWVKTEAKTIAPRLRAMEEKEGPTYYYFAHWGERRDQKVYLNIALFTLPNLPEKRYTLGGVAFDSEYLSREFFPSVLNSVLEEENADPQNAKSTDSPTVLMIHAKKDYAPLATSAGWDGGMPEVTRYYEGAFPGLALSIKFRGTTIEAISQRFLRNSFLIIGGLSLVLAGGVFWTYRNVAREMALARLKSDFVANVSHELRTPLALIRLYAETLEMGRLTSPGKYEEYFRIIRKESERLSGLINNILDFSRIEAGKKEYDFTDTNLAELIRSTLDAYRYQIEQQGFVLQANIADDLPPLRVDREAIARSLLNLINNALKYSAGNKFLGVNLYRENGRVKLEVIDHGIGIPRSELPKIFDKFYRVGDPLVHNTKGSGLGLSLVRHIVRAHGGEVLVESAPGKGSKFTIELPAGAGGSEVAAA